MKMFTNLYARFSVMPIDFLKYIKYLWELDFSHIFQLGIFFLLCLFIAGAWLGFWGVRKLILDESGAVDQDVAYFVEWSMLIFAAAMILQVGLFTLTFLSLEVLNFLAFRAL